MMVVKMAVMKVDVKVDLMVDWSVAKKVGY